MQITIKIIITPTPEEVDHAHDELLRRMFYARNKDTLGGYDAWRRLCAMYGGLEYADMIEHLSTITGRGQATRNICIENIKIIMRSLGYEI